MPNSLATRPSTSASVSTSAATSTRGSRCQPGMCARSAQRPAPTTATRSSLLLMMGGSSSRGGDRTGRGDGREYQIPGETGSSPAQPDPGVDDGVGDVHDEAHDDHEQR